MNYFLFNYFTIFIKMYKSSFLYYINEILYQKLSKDLLYYYFEFFEDWQVDNLINLLILFEYLGEWILFEYYFWKMPKLTYNPDIHGNECDNEHIWI